MDNSSPFQYIDRLFLIYALIFFLQKNIRVKLVLAEKRNKPFRTKDHEFRISFKMIMKARDILFVNPSFFLLRRKVLFLIIIASIFVGDILALL